MTIKLHKLHKQCGNKIIEFKNGRINGYTIISYSNYKPLEIIQDVSIPRPDRPLSFDGQYYLIRTLQADTLKELKQLITKYRSK